ncbi:MAG: cation:proton antiporter [Lentisphaeria bacterium]
MNATPHQIMITITAALAAGGGLFVLARWLRLPGIVFLLAAGVLLGPECAGLVQPEGLGNALPALVSLAVGLILFEGGLTLDVNGYRTASGVIHRLLTLGVLVTWLGVAAAVWLLFGKSYPESLLAASLVIVTGPTVIIPLLRRIRIRENLHSILHWEGVLIDPIGVFIALLCYEVFLQHAGGWALANFLVRVLVGLGVGVAGGLVMHGVFRFRWLPADQGNVFAITGASLVFGAAEYVRSESGILAVTVAGFVLGLCKLPEIKQIRQFKAEISDLLIGILFILLAARLQVAQFRELGMAGFLAIGAIVFWIRPLNILACTRHSGLGWREKLFLSWVAPRGIVAASMASLFAMGLQQAGAADARFIETFTYSIIILTVVIQGVTAGPLAWLLGLRRAAPDGWVIVGAHAFARGIAGFISATAGKKVVLLDSNPRTVALARAGGFDAVEADALAAGVEDRQEFQGVGRLLALTDNEDLNELICARWRDSIGLHHTFRWSTTTRSHPGTAGSGKVVFRGLPKPSLISSELEQNEAGLVTVTQLPPHGSCFPAGRPILFNMAKRGVMPVAEPAAVPKGTRACLLVQRDTDHLGRSLRPELVLESAATNMNELLEELVQHIVACEPGLDRRRLLQELVERHADSVTLPGCGVAIPHGYCRGLRSGICAVARLAAPLLIKNDTGPQSVHLVFLLLSPPGDPGGHLATLAEIARLADHAAIRSRLNTIPPQKLYAELRGFLNGASGPP